MSICEDLPTSENNMDVPPLPTDSLTLGHPVQIVRVENADSETATGTKNFVLDCEALERILLDSGMRDKKVALVSVAGAFRKGKSFLLNFFLRYLEACSRCKDQAGADPTTDTSTSNRSAGAIPWQRWLGDLTEPLEGFSWRGGSERDTTGILFWSKPFLIQQSNGQEVAVLLMDTQGAFDSESTVKDCATVFALSTMLSSVQVFNLTQNIQEDDLQHLQLFTEYGRLALEEERSVKPFQRLHFLVRDWSYPYEYSYGAEGGEKVLKVRLEVRERQHEELQQLRKHIRDCFEEISCFLMPHPGLSVATNPHFDGRLSEMEPVFREQLQQLVPLLLSPDNLPVKRINGEEVSAMQLLEYVKAYVKIYQGDELPEPKSMLLATAEANNLAAVASSKDIYSAAMDTQCGGDTPYMSPPELEQAHASARGRALAHFENLRKMGGPDYSASYAEQLGADCDALLERHQSANEAKNVFMSARTPAVLLVMAMAAYFLAGVLDVVGLDPVASLLTWFLWVAVVALATWCYVRYSGQMRDAGLAIDTVAELLWERLIQPLYVVLTAKAAEHATRHTAARLGLAASVGPAAGRARAASAATTASGDASLRQRRGSAMPAARQAY